MGLYKARTLNEQIIIDFDTSLNLNNDMIGPLTPYNNIVFSGIITNNTNVAYKSLSFTMPCGTYYQGYDLATKYFPLTVKAKSTTSFSITISFNDSEFEEVYNTWFPEGNSAIRRFISGYNPTGLSPVGDVPPWTLNLRVKTATDTSTDSRQVSFLGGNGGSAAGLSDYPKLPTLIIAKYNFEATITTLNFARYDNSKNTWSDNGNRICCKKIEFSLSNITINDLTSISITCSGESSTNTVQIKNKFSSASKTGTYSENSYSSSNIFYGFTANLGSTYTITLSLTDGYETVSSSIIIGPAFAKLHLAGASTGGVAVGMFSSATQGNPKFEVAQSHTSYFKGPVYFENQVYFSGSLGGGEDEYKLGEVDTGKKWIDGKTIYRYIYHATVNLVADVNDLTVLPRNVGTLITAYGSMKMSVGRIFAVPVSHYQGTQRAFGVIISENNDLRVSVGSGMTGNQEVTIVLEYTSV